jgi:hypothetical protein
MDFWKLLYIGGGVACVAVILIAVLSANQGGSTASVAPTPTVVVPATPVETPRRPKFNVN